MTEFDVVPVAPNPISYLDAVAEIDAARDIKQRLLMELGIQPGQVALDVGCGPGTDLGQLAGAVGPSGWVLGIDADAAMVGEARRRFAQVRQIRVCAGDAYALPLSDASVDRARVDRVLQHLDNPESAVAELHRVLRVGGRLGLAEPDWDTLAIDDVDIQTSRTFTRFVTDKTRHGTIGRQLSRLAATADSPSSPSRPARWSSATSKLANRYSDCSATLCARYRPGCCQRSRRQLARPAGQRPIHGELHVPHRHRPQAGRVTPAIEWRAAEPSTVELAVLSLWNGRSAGRAGRA